MILLLLLVLITLGLILRRIHDTDPFRDIPGPLLARCTPLWLAYQSRMGRRYLAVHELHQKYGTFVRISPNHISAAHRDAIPVIYGQGTRAFSKSAAFYAAFVGEDSEPSVFSTTDRRDHAQKRRMVSGTFSAKALGQFTDYMHVVMGTFVGKVDEMCETGEWADALLWFNYLAFDVLSDLAFGEAIGMVRRGSDVVSIERHDGSVGHEHAIALVDEREHLAAVLGLHPWFKCITKFIPDPFFIRGRRCSAGLEDLARRRVTQRLKCGTDRNDILSKLVKAREEDPEQLTAKQITALTAEAVTLLIAGSDTTSNSMTAILHLVVTHPRVHREILDVLEEAFDGDSAEMSYEHVKDIPYLDATIDEGLRIFATTAIGLHRSVPAGGAHCCGRFFPEGTEMSVPAWTIQHDARIWGDPEVFRPERWLESKDLKACLLTFGKGPRACLGRNLAYMEMRLVLGTVLLRYDIQLQSPVLETTEGFMHKPRSMMVRFSRRERRR
ncbi:benzoate para-hydroxylase [Hymenopellis radicata]|nr:benzoate para-hydroxylase [Hymenopellis radicata]